MTEEWGDVRVLVTGASQGIGLGIAREFLRVGARVAISGRNRARLGAARAALADDGHDIAAITGDVSTSAGCEQLIAAAVERLGGLDVLCANAGIYPELPIAELTDEHVDDVFSTNLKGTVFATKAAVKHLTSSGRGRVIVTSSITGPTTGYPGLSVYAASKAAQLGFVRTAAVELASCGITVNAVSPGAIRTEGLNGLGTEAIAAMERVIPAGRLGEPADIGAAALFLASRAAGFVTGQEITIDGGQTLPEVPGLF